MKFWWWAGSGRFICPKSRWIKKKLDSLRTNRCIYELNNGDVELEKKPKDREAFPLEKSALAQAS